MRTINLILGLICVGGYSAAQLHSNDIKIIANQDVTASEISREDVNRIFLITKTSLPGASHVEPVLAVAGTAHAVFLKEYLGRTDAALMTYYRALMFTGKAPIPKTFRSDAEVAAYVAKTPGAVGYVASAANTASVKVLKVR